MTRRVDELVEQVRLAESLEEARDRLGIGYREFNETLEMLGAPYGPLRNPEAHREAFDVFVQVHREEILASLRMRFLPCFENNQPLDEYVRLRDLPGLAPDGTWLEEYAVPDEGLIRERVNQWLVLHSDDPISNRVNGLFRLGQVRETNSGRLDSFAKKAGPIVRAWAREHDVDPHAVWSNFQAGSAGLSERAWEEGILDFRPLEDSDFIAWLSRTSRWPESMPRTVDPGACGLTEAELQRESQKRRDERRRREELQRIITADGHEMSADPADFRALIYHIDGSITPDLLKSSTRYAPLTAIDQSPCSSGGGSGAAPRGYTEERMTDIQKAAIGLVGELVAYRWIQEQYPHLTDDSWRSTYRNFVLGGDQGDDTLGYDFVVPRSGGDLYYEVKASIGDATEIELGSSEVARAQRLARRDRYRVILVRNALDSVRRSLHVLPNPYRADVSDFYRPVGAALRFRFSLG